MHRLVCELSRDEIIMINRLVNGQGGDLQTLKRFLAARNGKSRVVSSGRWWSRLITVGFFISLPPLLRQALDTHHASGISAAWIWYTVIIAEFVLVFFLARRYGPKLRKRNKHTNKYGLCTQCVKCEHDLKGLESALGDDFWVGPEVCPECEQEYPAVGV